jgi:predicted alpha/beta-fold hydrolase
MQGMSITFVSTATMATAFSLRDLRMRTENYKNAIIGSGVGGKFLAWYLAE